MSQPKHKVNKKNVNTPFPYPLINSKQQQIWPFKSEGFILIYATLCKTDNLVLIDDTIATFALIKMGFFGYNSNKEINHFYIMEKQRNEELSNNKPSNSSSNFTLGTYSFSNIDIPNALENFEHDANINQQNSENAPVKNEVTQPTLKICLEEAYFLSYVFGLLLVSKDEKNYFNLKEMWTCFCQIYKHNDPIDFATKYASYHYFRSKGWIVRNGSKFGTDYLLYKEGPPFYHALYSVIITYQIQGEKTNKDFKWNEISALSRVTRNTHKELLICLVSVPEKAIENCIFSPECIQKFTIDLIHINRWNSFKGESDSLKTN